MALRPHALPIEGLAAEGVIRASSTMQLALFRKAVGAQVVIRAALALEAQALQRLHVATVACDTVVLQRQT